MALNATAAAANASRSAGYRTDVIGSDRLRAMTQRNLITDVAGVRVGHAQDARIASGVTAIVFDPPAVASMDIRGGGTGTRESVLLDPAMTIERIDAIALAGGSAFGLEAASGVMSWLAEQGRGFAMRSARVPIVPGAILFDLLNGGDKNWGRYPPYRELGHAAAAAAADIFALGSAGAGLGATTVNLKGGLGSASAAVHGFTVGALAAVNAAGSVTDWARALVLGGSLRAKQRIRRPRFSDTVADGRARLPDQEPSRREHDAGGGGLRRGSDQDAGTPLGDHGSGRCRAGDPAGPYPARWRPGVRRSDRVPPPRRPYCRPRRPGRGRR